MNNREAGDLRLYRAHYDVIVMILFSDSTKPLPKAMVIRSIHQIQNGTKFCAPGIGFKVINVNLQNIFLNCADVLRHTQCDFHL